MKTVTYIVALISLILLIVLLLIAGEASAADYVPDIDYMAIMAATAAVGDADCGHQAEEFRNAKIDGLGLDYKKVSWDNLYLLGKIIYAEAGSDWLSDDWKMSVGEVVLNRVASPGFPNTISGVVYQPGQYYGTQSKFFENLHPDARCVRMALRLLEGERILNDSSVVYQANFKQGRGTHTAMYDRYLGWTYFCFG